VRARPASSQAPPRTRRRRGLGAEQLGPLAREEARRVEAAPRPGSAHEDRRAHRGGRHRRVEATRLSSSCAFTSGLCRSPGSCRSARAPPRCARRPRRPPDARLLRLAQDLGADVGCTPAAAVRVLRPSFQRPCSTAIHRDVAGPAERRQEQVFRAATRFCLPPTRISPARSSTWVLPRFSAMSSGTLACAARSR